MKPRISALLQSLVVAGTLLAVPAMGASMSNLPAEKTQGNVSYMSGGIGSSESAAMRKEEAKFPLTLEFVENATPKPEHLANVAVTIRDHTDKVVLNTVANGPYLLAKLPPGKYTVTAVSDGRVKTHAVSVASAKQAEVLMEW
jgi:hypothetical protein